MAMLNVDPMLHRITWSDFKMVLFKFGGPMEIRQITKFFIYKTKVIDCYL